MRKVTVSMFMSLDGVMEDPKWTFAYWTDEIAGFKYDELFSHDTLLLGGVTYEGFAQVWPDMTDEQGYADRMNGIPKHVVSTTLQKAAWNNSSIINHNVVEEIAKLKQEDGRDILVFGSCTLVKTLMEHNLVDRYNLLVYPIVLGSGKRLFTDCTEAKLKLSEAKSFSSGAMALVYEAA